MWELDEKQEAFEKRWAHSPQRAVSRQFTRCRHCTVARRLRIDVHNDDNDNAWQRGPLWPHGMGPISRHPFNGKWLCTLMKQQEILGPRVRFLCVCVCLSHSGDCTVSECQSDERWEIAIFSQNWLPWQRPLRYREKKSRSSAPKTLSFGEKSENRSSGYWDNCSINH